MKKKSNNVGISPATIRSQRVALRLSQCELSRLAGLHRLRVHSYEAGDIVIGLDEQAKIAAALRTEANRLREFAATLDQSPAQLSVEVPV